MSITRDSRKIAATLSVALFAAVPVGVVFAQPTYATLDYGSNTTFLSGVYGNFVTGTYTLPDGDSGGLLYNEANGNWNLFPFANNGSDYPGAISSVPYGPEVPSPGILDVVGSYITSASSPYQLSYWYNDAAAQGSKLTTLAYPQTPGGPTLSTVAHSINGNQIVGSYFPQADTSDTGTGVPSSAFIYNTTTGTYTALNYPGAASTEAFGVWGNMIAGTYRLKIGGTAAGFTYNESTGVWTSYSYPGATQTRFHGITGGNVSGYNVVGVYSVNNTSYGLVLHIGPQGATTWLSLSFPGAVDTSGNSIYGNTVIGVYNDNGSGNLSSEQGFIATLPNL
jgi:hypothetical protein